MCWTVLLAASTVMVMASAVGPETPPRQWRLPGPDRKGKMTLEAALARRRSIRQYARAELTEKETSQLCWAATGITEPRLGLRTAPSAGALYPLEIYLATAKGVFRYQSRGHLLQGHLAGDRRKALRQAALDQGCVQAAPVCFVIAAAERRCAVKYGQRARRYCLLEAGHVAQNIHLQATALSLGSVPIGAFRDDRVAAAIRLPADQRPIYLIPVGRLESARQAP